MSKTHERLKAAGEVTLAVVVLGLLGAAMNRGANPAEAERRTDGMVAAARLQAESVNPTLESQRRTEGMIAAAEAERAPRRELTREEILARGQYHD